MKASIFSFFISISLLLTPLHAVPLTFQFSGAVTQVPEDDVFGDIAFGSPIQGSFTFDTSAIDLIPADSATASFSWTSPFGMNATVAGHQFNANGNLSIGILNSSVDQYTVLATGPDLTLELFLQDDSGSVFSSDQLPLSPPSLDHFTAKDFHLIAEFEAGEVQADGQLTSLNGPGASEVPEPRQGFMLAGAALLLAITGFAGASSSRQLSPERRKTR